MAMHVGGRSERSATSAIARALDLLRNVLLLLGLYVAYALVRRITADDYTTAFQNARWLVGFQEAIGLPSEQIVQSWFLYHPGLIRAGNTFYMWVHFPGTALFLLWAWLRHRGHFGLIRSSLIALTSAGMMLHLVFPLAPPRKLTSQGYIDTGALFGPSPYDIAASGAANQIAAMPSLHVGWALLVAISVVALSSSHWRHAIWAHPALTTTVVVMTANHYWADAIIAALLVVGSWVFMVRLKRMPMLRLPHHGQLPHRDQPPPPRAADCWSIVGDTPPSDQQPEPVG